MGSGDMSKLVEILQKYEEELIEHWIKEQLEAITLRRDLMADAQLREQSRQFVGLFRQAIVTGSLTHVTGPEWSEVREMLSAMSKSRAEQGFSSSETATFVFSFKQPLFERLRMEHGEDSRALAEDVWVTTVLVDKLGLLSTEAYQKSRLELVGAPKEEVIGSDAERFCWDSADRIAFRQEVERKGYVRNFEFSIRRKDWSTRHCLLNFSTWRDPGDTFSGYLSIVRDVTERREAEKDRPRLKAAIEQAAETILITDPGGGNPLRQSGMREYHGLPLE